MTKQIEPQFKLRLPQVLKTEIEIAAAKNMRSINAEIVYRLAQSVDTTSPEPLFIPGREEVATHIDANQPNRLLDCNVRVIAVEQAHLGVLQIDTDQGFIPIAVNRNAAAMLISELAMFMAADEVDEDEEPANDDEAPN